MLSVSSSYCLQAINSLPPVQWFSKPGSIEKIQILAKRALGQLALSFAVNVTFCAVFGSFFVPPSMTVLTLAIGAMLSLTLVGGAIQTIWHRTHPSQATHSPSFAVGWEKLGGHLARLSLVNTLTLKLNRMIHELGHASAALLTFMKANPQIIANTRSGSTTYNISYGLTRFGKLLGEHRALLFTTAAGLAAPLLLAMGEFAIAHHLSERHLLIRDFLNYHALSQLLDLIIYCSILALSSSKDLLIHDSILLWQVGGIHPLVTLSVILALPITELYLFHRTA